MSEPRWEVVTHQGEDRYVTCKYECKHTLFEHSRLIAGWPCRMVDLTDDGEWVDCPCACFVRASSPGTEIPETTT